MSGENEAAGSSKPSQESTEPDCNAENVLTSSTNYGTSSERESPIATFQALKQQNSSVIERVPGVGVVGGDSNLLSAAISAAAAAAAAASIPLINNSSNSSDSKISAAATVNNNNNVVNPNKRLFECDVCKMS